MLIIIAGATACGKSSLAVAIAKHLGGEIISADSMQIYKKMDIGTAKIAESEMDGIPHHLIDIVEPSESFSVAEYVALAEKKIVDIENRGKIAIITGGTGLYIRSLIYPFHFGDVNRDEALRAQLFLEAEKFGNEFVHQKLRTLSEEKANEIHKNNVKRVVRAIEILSSPLPTIDNFENLTPKRNFLYFVLMAERQVLYTRINARVDKMLYDGLEYEVKSLLDGGLNFEMQSMQAIGYKEWKNCFDGKNNIYQISEEIKQNSRNYAKRQVTWFKKEKYTICLDSSKNTEVLVMEIVNYYKNSTKQEY